VIGTAAPAPRVVVMGVAGSGKSTIGALIADELDVPFIDGDSLHPIENVRKMAGGTPLDDVDRAPWLRSVGAALGAADGGVVIACSALKAAYRDLIVDEAPGVVFVHLTASRDVLASRMEGRTDHFMPATLLDSQLRTLEPLSSEERGATIDVSESVEQVVARAVEAVGDLQLQRG
jgi:carbohydrate kinase (thermoresistant glucokinase family)